MGPARQILPVPEMLRKRNHQKVRKYIKNSHKKTTFNMSLFDIL